jgi:hypothetical protein
MHLPVAHLAHCYFQIWTDQLLVSHEFFQFISRATKHACAVDSVLYSSQATQDTRPAETTGSRDLDPANKQVEGCRKEKLLLNDTPAAGHVRVDRTCSWNLCSQKAASG